MDITSTLSALHDSLVANQATLDSLINQLDSQSLASDDPTLYTSPTGDPATGLWTLAQSSANTDNGEYLGIYTLPDSSLCSQITEVTVVSHSAPAAPNAPARVLPPGVDPLTGWVDLASAAALALQEFVTFAISPLLSPR